MACAMHTVDEQMHHQVGTIAQEQCSGYIAHPFLYLLHLGIDAGHRHSAIGYDPSDDHDGQSGTQTKDHRQEPIPSEWQREGNIHHGEEVHQSVGTKSNGEKYTEHKAPQSAVLSVEMPEPFAHSVVVLMMMLTRKEEQHAADNHEGGQQGFAPMLKQMLDALRARAHYKRNSQQGVGGQLAEDEECATLEYATLIVDILVDIANGSNACE